MRRTGWLLAILLMTGWAVPAAAQTTSRIGQAVDFAWDFTDAQINEGQVTRFEVQIDTATRINSGLPVLPAGTYRYRVPQALLTVGAHTFRVWACNATECSSTSANTTHNVLPLTPQVPSNPRAIPVPLSAALTVPQALELANSYSFVLRVQDLTPDETNFIVATWPGWAVTQENVIAHMDWAAINFLGARWP